MNLPKTICMLPWISIETSPIGTARPCCLAREEITDDNGDKFDLNKHNLETIYHSDYMQTLRKRFRNGDKPETCKLCWEEEAAGRTSKRINSRIRLKELYAQVDWENDNPNQLWFLDLKLGNICNLKCRICGSWSSSKWAAEELDYMPRGFDKKKHVAYQWLKKGAWPQNKDTSFWNNLKKLLPNIKYLEFTGGEPFLIKEHFDLLKFAVDNGYSKNIDIHYNTNGTINPDESQLWNHFGRVDIAFSIDNVNDRFEYERYGAKWADINNNINHINALKAHNHVNLTTQLCLTINIQNVFYLDELLAWAESKNFDNIYFNMMHSPDHMSIQKMTVAAQQLILNKLKNTVWTSRSYQREIDGIIKFIENGTGSDGTEFLEKMKNTDSYRKQNFLDTHKEIAIAMGY